LIAADRGLVLRVYPYREASAIVSFLGFAAARVRFVAHGGRASRNRFAGCLEPGNEIDAVYEFAPSRELGTLKEATLHRAHLAGAGRLDVLGTGWAALELLDRLVPDGAQEPGLGEEAARALAALRGATDRSEALLHFYGFELRLLSRLGLRPTLSSCAVCRRPASAAAGAVDLETGSYRCRSCGGRAGGGRLPLSASAGRLFEWLDGAMDVAAGPTEPRDRRLVGLCLHRLLATHLDRYQLPRALALLKKVDMSGRTSIATPPVTEFRTAR
jgi:DNA repair protein RecO